jgi:hypothetical protein
MAVVNLAWAHIAARVVTVFKSAFAFDPGVDSEDERTARRYFGLAFCGLALFLSTWGWTLAHANYAAALEDLLTLGQGRPVNGLGRAVPWAIGFYSVDSVFFIACYFGFGLLIARQLQRLLDEDRGKSSSKRYPHHHVLGVAAFLLTALAVSDAAENVTALLMLATPTALPKVSKVFAVATRAKTGFALASTVWNLGAVLVWITGAAIRSNVSDRATAQLARREVRDGLIDVLGRTRYCFLSIVIFALLMLGIDQAQDVLAGLASLLDAEWTIKGVLLLAVALGVFALHTYAHAIWVWVRLLVRIRRPLAPEKPTAAVVTFSKWWGRLLGAAPWFVILVLCVRTAGGASQVGDVDTAWFLLGAGVCATAWGISFILLKEIEGRKLRPAMTYYAAEDSEAVLLKDPAYRFLGIKRSPLWIPIIAVVGTLAVRASFVFLPTSVACHALAAISFGFALWTCIVNRLALNSIRSRFPWIIAIALIIGGLAGAGLTQNHVVLSGRALDLTASGAQSLRHMFWLTLLLSIGFVLGYVLWTRAALKQVSWPQILASWLIVIVWSGAVLIYGSRGQTPRAIPAVAEIQRPTLAAAVTGWLKNRAAKCGADCPAIPIYFVSAEGGGIRAAYFTGSVLAELSKQRDGEADLKLAERVFSLSGVSGGSLGVMAWRLCLDSEPLGVDKCVQPLGHQDLLTPLASVWMYEDALALVLPTSKCDLPGCGFVDRGSWFERSLEKGVSVFGNRLPQAAPYVFLNATWVETGERAIASNLQIETKTCVNARRTAAKRERFAADQPKDCVTAFATARDQLFEIDAPARSSTLAHDSARFPYFNPIGYIRDDGHLADGGYFENSGTQTTADIVQEFVRQLTCKGTGCELGDEIEVAKLRDKVTMTAIMIRNGVRGNADPSESLCAAPRARPGQNLFANAAGPIITALNATGIGAPNRVAQCNLQRLLSTLKETFPRQTDEGGYIDVRLINQDTLYPLGWYLSPAARTGISTAASECVHTNGLGKVLAASEGSRSLTHGCFMRMH